MTFEKIHSETYYHGIFYSPDLDMYRACSHEQRIVCERSDRQLTKLSGTLHDLPSACHIRINNLQPFAIVRFQNINATVNGLNDAMYFSQNNLMYAQEVGLLFKADGSLITHPELMDSWDNLLIKLKDNSDQASPENALGRKLYSFNQPNQAYITNHDQF